MREALCAGANDLGGTLMDESITRAAGATHGQEMTQADMLSLAASVGRRAMQRTTLYRRPQNSPARPSITSRTASMNESHIASSTGSERAMNPRGAM
jgi:FO synthase